MAAPHLIDRDVPLMRGVVEPSPVDPSNTWVPVCITHAVLCTLHIRIRLCELSNLTRNTTYPLVQCVDLSQHN